MLPSGRSGVARRSPSPRAQAQPATRAQGHDTARQPDLALAVPVADERLDPGHVIEVELVRRAAALAGTCRRISRVRTRPRAAPAGPPRRTTTSAARLHRRCPRTPGPTRRRAHRHRPAAGRPIVVRPRTTPGPRSIDQLGQQGAHPDPGEAPVRVVRVQPRGHSPAVPAARPRRVHVGPGQVQEGPTPQPGPLLHRRERPRSRAAGQAQQHRLGLVLPGVPEQHRRGTPVVRGPAPVPRSAPFSRPPPGRPAPEASTLTTSAAVAPRARLRSSPPSAPCRPIRLQPVVDDHRPHDQAASGAHPCARASECQRVGSAGAGDEHRRSRLEVRDGSRRRPCGRRRSRAEALLGAHATVARPTRSSQRAGSWISALDGRVCGRRPRPIEAVHPDAIDDMRARRRRRRCTAAASRPCPGPCARTSPAFPAAPAGS